MTTKEIDTAIDLLKYAITDTIKDSIKETVKQSIRDVTRETVKEAIRETFRSIYTSLGWKHFFMVAIPLVAFYKRNSIAKLLWKFPSNETKTHVVQVYDMAHVKEIILTSCEMVTFENLSKIHIKKGTEPKHFMYKPNEILLLKQFSKKVNTNEKQQEIQPLQDEINHLNAQNLWNNYRLSKIQNPKLKVILIQASEEILKIFFLRFYNMNEGFKDKIGSFEQSKLNILRFDSQTGTYQHIVSQLGIFRDQN